MAPLQPLDPQVGNDSDRTSEDGVAATQDKDMTQEQERSSGHPVEPGSARPVLTSPEQSVLSDVLRDNDVFLGGASMGKGFRHAARHFLRNELATMEMIEAATASSGSQSAPACLSAQEEMRQKLLTQALTDTMVEEPFYVCDLGVVVAQFLQWKRHFPRVVPYYAVKCNPDPVIVKTLVRLGANFDCASPAEIAIVEECSADLPQRPDIIFANPCKPRTHIRDAVRKNVLKVTFDNAAEVIKCAQISMDIQLVLRIITDDTGAQCRLSSKFGAPRNHWRDLLRTAKVCGLPVVGVSFHVGSGCRDASRYDLALRDAREVFDMGINEFGFDMHILDIGGGFPGETHSLWNPADLYEVPDEDHAEEEQEDEQELEALRPFMFFADIADHITPILDEIFPEDNIKIIGEPGRYLVAASSTVVVAITSIRSNLRNKLEVPVSVSDKAASKMIYDVSREEENVVIRAQGALEHPVLNAIVEQIADYSQLFAKQQLTQQEVDCLVDVTKCGLLNPPDIPAEEEAQQHTVEGIRARIVGDCMDKDTRPRSLSFDNEAPTLTLASAGEAAVSGVVKQAMVDSGAANDDFAYYVNDGVYGAFNNLMFDHAVVRPRLLRSNPLKSTKHNDDRLYPSTIFGPTCDSIDVICRSVLLPQLEIGDWLYFENMGAYTSAAASTFNGFSHTKKFYVCSVLPEML